MKQLFAFIFICVSLTLAGSIREGTMQARSDGSNVTVQWGSTDESGIKEFEILRRDGTVGEFVTIAVVQKNNRANSYYQYIDKSAFKTTGTIYQYQIRVILSNGGFETSSIITVSHNVSSVKRTWGSLKAMFR